MAEIVNLLPRIIRRHLTTATPVLVGRYVLVYRLVGSPLPLLEPGATNWDNVPRTGIFQAELDDPRHYYFGLSWRFVTGSLTDPHLLSLLELYLQPAQVWRCLPTFSLSAPLQRPHPAQPRLLPPLPSPGPTTNP